MAAPAATTVTAPVGESRGTPSAPPAVEGTLVPVTVFSGFLGAGKTTILLNLVRQLNSNSGDGDSGNGAYRVAWLKNEYGEVAVDSRLAAESSIDVTEVLNGCVCCTAVGKLGPAISELLSRFHPQRILLETSGSSHPAPLAWELRRLAAAGLPVQLDALICVIDCVNFSGYEDRSHTARLQTKFTDLLLLNKHELADEEQIDKVVDSVCDLNPHTPRIRTNKGFVDQRLLIGLDSALWKHMQAQQQHLQPHTQPATEVHDDADICVLDLTVPASSPLPWARWQTMLAALPKDAFYRVKGVLLLPQPLQPSDEEAFAALCSAAADGSSASKASAAVAAASPEHAADCQCERHSSAAAGPGSSAPAAVAAPSVPSYPYLLNWAFGRSDALVPLLAERYFGATRVTFMGDRDAPRSMGRICEALQVESSAIRLL